MPSSEMRVTAACHGSLKSLPLEVGGSIAVSSHMAHQDQNAIIVSEGEKKKKSTIFKFCSVFSYSVFFSMGCPRLSELKMSASMLILTKPIFILV